LRLKDQYRRWEIEFGRKFPELSDYGLVATMHTIEVPNRRNTLPVMLL
jgi:hypothetical protein